EESMLVQSLREISHASRLAVADLEHFLPGLLQAEVSFGLLGIRRKEMPQLPLVGSPRHDDLVSSLIGHALENLPHILGWSRVWSTPARNPRFYRDFLWTIFGRRFRNWSTRLFCGRLCLKIGSGRLFAACFRFASRVPIQQREQLQRRKPLFFLVLFL